MKRRCIYALLIVLAVCGVFLGCSKPRPEPAALEAPTGLRVEDGVLVWDEVENAIGYLVYVNHFEYEVKDCSYALPEQSLSQEYKIEVVALGDGVKYSNSESATLLYTPEYPTEYLDYRLLDDMDGYEVSRGRADLHGRVVIPDYFSGLPVKKIADGAFYYSNALTHNVDTGDGCNTITTSVRLPAFLEEIGEQAFSHCIALADIVIPNGLKNIELLAFYNCRALIEVKIPDSVSIISEGAFYGCQKLEKVSIPEGVTEIGTKAFSTSALKSIELPSTIERLGESAFESCKGLRSARFSNSSDSKSLVLDQSIFSGCIALADVVLSRNIQRISMYMFRSCVSLQSLLIPEGIVEIIGYAFLDCWSLESIELPSTLDMVGGSAFSKCKNLKSVRFADGSDSKPIVLQGGIFSNCEALTEVVLPNNIQSIQNGMFSGCKALESISIPEGVEEIGWYAFYRCTALKNIEFNGTMAQWNAISKGSSWNFGTGDYTVICTDGTLSKSESE